MTGIILPICAVLCIGGLTAFLYLMSGLSDWIHEFTAHAEASEEVEDMNNDEYDYGHDVKYKDQEDEI